MALAVCLLPDGPGERAVRALWRRLEADGVPSMASHTHGRHVPHLSYAVLRTWDEDAVAASLAALPDAGPTLLHVDALGMFRRSRCSLVPAVTPDLSARQGRVSDAVVATGADLHRHYRPGVWVPHLTLAPRLHLDQLATVAAAVNDVLPLRLTLDGAALVETGTGRRRALPHVP